MNFGKGERIKKKATLEELAALVGGQVEGDRLLEITGIASLEEFWPRIRKAYLIGEAANAFAAALEGKVATEMSATLENALASAAADAAPRESRSSSRSCTPPNAPLDMTRTWSPGRSERASASTSASRS